jgi:hypothetical protein
VRILGGWPAPMVKDIKGENRPFPQEGYLTRTVAMLHLVASLISVARENGLCYLWIDRARTLTQIESLADSSG